MCKNNLKSNYKYNWDKVHLNLSVDHTYMGSGLQVIFVLNFNP